MSVFQLDGKTAVVTGGGSGIGRAIAELFARQGAQVVLFEKDEAAGRAVVEKVEQDGGRAALQPCDVAQRADVDRALADTLGEFGALDILVNNAAIAHVGNIEDTTEEDLDHVYRVNVKGVFHCTQAAIRPMLQQGGGVITNLASVASRVAVKDRFAYSMSKGAVFTMTLSTAIDYVDQNIRCNCVCPARVHTPFVDGYLKQNYAGQEEAMFAKLSAYQPLGRMAQPAEIAAAVLYLSSDEAAFVTGSALTIDGGVTSLI